MAPRDNERKKKTTKLWRERVKHSPEFIEKQRERSRKLWEKRKADPAFKEKRKKWDAAYSRKHPYYALKLETKSRAKRDGRAFMSAAEWKKLVERAAGRCEITGILFDFTKTDRFVRRPFAASVDRIDNTKGYEFENCRLILAALNFAINEWGEDIYLGIAKQAVLRSYSVGRI